MSPSADSPSADTPSAARPREPGEPTEVRVAAARVRPGDHLPPQPALHGTPWRETGFTVGTGDRDVCRDLPVIPGAVLLFGADGTLAPLTSSEPVLVRRAEAGAPAVGAPTRAAPRRPGGR